MISSGRNDWEAREKLAHIRSASGQENYYPLLSQSVLQRSLRAQVRKFVFVLRHKIEYTEDAMR